MNSPNSCLTASNVHKAFNLLIKSSIKNTDNLNIYPNPQNYWIHKYFNSQYSPEFHWENLFSRLFIVHNTTYETRVHTAPNPSHMIRTIIWQCEGYRKCERTKNWFILSTKHEKQEMKACLNKIIKIKYILTLSCWFSVTT